MKTISLLSLLFIFSTCHRKDFFHAPKTCQLYVDNFVAEGLKRGKFIQPEKGGLIIQLGPLEEHQLGKSKPKKFPKSIIINQEIWPDLDTFQRRALMFHELAHCLLNRKHRNQQLPNGECASLLNGKKDSFNCFTNLYSELWWNYYVDELFDSTVEVPIWYNAPLTNYQQNFHKSYLMSDWNPTFELDTTITINLLEKHYQNSVGKRGGWFFFDMDTSRNYQIDVTFQTKEDSYKSYKILWNDLNFRITPNHLVIATIDPYNKQSKWGITSSFFQKKLIRNPPIKKLTIRKVNHLFYFFFNEKFIHIIETGYTQRGKYWWNNATNKSVLKTDFIYENEANLNIKIAYLN